MESKPNAIEKAPKPLLKVTLMRHEIPNYADDGHDLTDEGVERAKQRGREWKEQGHFEGSDLIFIKSPAPRAGGTMDFVLEGAGIEDAKVRTSHSIRNSDIRNRDALLQRLLGEPPEGLGGDFEAMAKDHHVNDDFNEHSPHIIEPNSEKEARFYRALDVCIRWFASHQNIDDTIPHVLSVSHFELITALIRDVFGDVKEQFDRYHTPSFGEYVHLEVFNTDQENRYRLVLEYSGQVREVIFNSETQRVEQVNE